MFVTKPLTNAARWLALLTVLAAHWVSAARPKPEQESGVAGRDGDFLFRMWDTTEGLLPTTVRAIAQTRDGYVWLASYDNVVRFDGTRVVPFSGRNVKILPTPLKASILHVDTRDRLWVATSDGRLFSMEKSTWQEWDTNTGWPGAVLQTIHHSPDGALHFAGQTNLLRFDGGRFVQVPLPALPVDFRGPLRSCAETNGSFWLAGQTHVWRRDGGAWKLIISSNDIGSMIFGLAPAHAGGAWIVTTRHVRRLQADGSIGATRNRPAGAVHETVQLLDDSRGNLWLGGLQTGLRIGRANGQFIRIGGGAEVLEPQILALFEDRERNILAGTVGAGLARFKPEVFKLTLGQPGSMAGVLVNSIYEEAPGRMLVATEGSGLYRVTEDQPPQVIVSTNRALTPRHRVTSLVRLHDGVVLAAVASKGLFRVGEEYAVPEPAPPPAEKLVRVLFEDSKRRLWMATDEGLFVRETGGAFAAFPREGNPAVTRIRAMTEDRNGTLWFVGRQGLGRARGGRLEKVAMPGLPVGTNFLGILATGDGTLWLGVENQGLLRIRDGKSFLFGADHSLPILSIGAIVEEAGSLWLPGELGLVRVTKTSLERVASGSTRNLETRFFNRADGLGSDAFRRTYQPVTARASDGRLWFATHKGAVSIDPANVITPAFDAPVTIEEVRIERTLVPITPANRDNVVVAAGTRHMTIRCTLPSLAKPEYMRFQYRLDGLDTDWRDAGGERVVRFYDIPPGQYRFRVRAFGDDGRFVEPGDVIGLTVLPLVWQTGWFKVLGIGGLAALVGLGVWRLMQMRLAQRDQRLRQQEERAHIESQLQQARQVEAIGRLAGGIAHDFNNLLTVIIGNTELARMEKQPGRHLDSLLHDVLSASSRARDLVVQILAYSRHRQTARAPLDIAPVLRDAFKLLRAGVPATVEIKADIPPSLPQVRTDPGEIQRLVMNLGTNAAQAIGPAGGRVSIAASDFSPDADYCAEHPKIVPGQYVRIIVQDNGHGMDSQVLSRIFDPFFTTKGVGKGTGLGLSVVQGIVESHGGAIHVRSRPNEGSCFEILLPATAAPTTPAADGSTPLQRGGGETILLVDDEPAVLSTARRMIESLGYTVESHVSPQEALAAFRASPERFQLVVTDFAMPRLNGVEMAGQIWRIKKDIPIILCTGYGGSIDPAAARQIGFARLVGKPYERSCIAESIATALKGKSVPAAAV
jgi:signal transduction histidine kinase/ligand-binding sensor domain-containing protein/CheY-like chemotaxis protein